jgi:hypothetical protein
MPQDNPEIMRIAISEHGRQRLKERTDVSDRKLEKMIFKAWTSIEPIPSRWRQKINSRRHDTEFRFYMGMLFCYQKITPNLMLFKTILNNRGRDLEYWSELNKRYYDRNPEPGLAKIDRG